MNKILRALGAKPKSPPPREKEVVHMTNETFTYVVDGKQVSISTGDEAFLDKVRWIRAALGGLPEPTVAPYYAIGRFDVPNSDLLQASLKFTRKDGTGEVLSDVLLTSMRPERAAHSINLGLGNGDIGNPQPLVNPAIIGEYKAPEPEKPAQDWEAVGSPIGGPEPGIAGCFRNIKDGAKPGERWNAPSGAVYQSGWWGWTSAGIGFSLEQLSMFARFTWRKL